MLIQERLDLADQAIKSGKLDEADRILDAVNSAELNSMTSLQFAKLLRRVRNSNKAVRILKPIVSSPSPKPQFIIEYCRNLQHLGINSESLIRIAGINTEQFPEAALIRAELLTSQWNYRRALPLLIQYVAFETDEYLRNIGHVNICANLIAINELHYGLEYADVVLDSFRQKKLDLLCSHIMEIQAQAHLLKGDYGRAQSALEESQNFLPDGSSRYHFYKEKWFAILLARRDSNVEPLKEFIEKCKSSQYWELARSATLQLAHVTRDQGLIDRLFFGSPSQTFRQRLFLLGLFPSSNLVVHPEAKNIFEVGTGHYNGEFIFGNKEKILQLIQTLCSDQFSPMSGGQLFSAMFSDEFYDSELSLNKVNQIIHRTREYLQETGIDLQIEVNNNLYSATPSKDLQVILTEKMISDTKLQTLREVFGDDVFSGKEAREALDLSKSATSRYLTNCIEEGKIKKSGRGVATFYFLC